MTIQLTVRAWSHEPGWLALPRWQECFHSSDQNRFKFMGTKGIVYIRKEFNFYRIWFGTSKWPPWRHVKTLYYMERASQEPLFLYRAWKQCAWAVCYPLSCFSLGSFAGPPGKRDYLENFHLGSRHHNTGIPANRSGWLAQLSYNGKVDFCCVKLRCWYLYKASQPGSCNQAPSSIARLNALPLDLADFLKPPPNKHTKFQ